MPMSGACPEAYVRRGAFVSRGSSATVHPCAPLGEPNHGGKDDRSANERGAGRGLVIGPPDPDRPEHDF